MRYVTITTWEIMEGQDFDLTMERVEAAAFKASSELLLSSPLALQEEQVGLVLGKGNR